MEADDFDETAFFSAIATSGARALLIGRRALIALGLPVLTQDYDLWLHIDDMEKLNQAVAPLAVFPNHAPPAARQRGRYKLENGTTIDVMVARSVPTIDGEQVAFDAVWSRRLPLEVAPGVVVHLPSLDDLIATKRFGGRPKDAEDIRLLQRLKARVGS